MLYIGIDLGTSAAKLLLMDETGKILHIVSKEYPLEFPHPGWSQQNPEDWLAAVEEGIPELLAGFDAAQVAGIGAGGQMHGLVVLDEDDNVIRPAILWNDGRTAKQVDYLNNVVGKEKLSQYTANIAFAGFTAPKLLWMRENEPDLFAKIDKIMLPKTPSWTCWSPTRNTRATRASPPSARKWPPKWARAAITRTERAHGAVRADTAGLGRGPQGQQAVCRFRGQVLARLPQPVWV